MDWIKLYTGRWLYGSGRAMTAEKRGVWIDLLALAGETKFRDGTLRFEVGKPMTRDWIANTLMIERNTLDVCLIAFQADVNIDDGQPRVRIWDDETIEIVNWNKFQGKPEKVTAKEEAIAEARRTKKARRDAINALIALVYELNKRLKSGRFEVRDNGTVVDTLTNRIISVEELKEFQRGQGDESTETD